MNRIVLISGASSIHTIRWANGLASVGLEVHVITKQTACDPFDAGVVVHQFPNRGNLGYFLMVPAVRRLLNEIKPDLVNAHYASGYGTTARLVNYRPYLLSVWGSDVYDFPHKSLLHKYLVRKNLLAADKVASTSNCMAEETRKLAPELGDIAITPFGVDMQQYHAAQPAESDDSRPIVIGTVKTMAPKYGISTLLQAFAILRNKCLADVPDVRKRLQLRLVGGGPQLQELKALAVTLGVDACAEFVGRVPHEKVPEELSKLDIYVALSESESFGVAIIEAGAAARPVVVSNAGGLPEVTVDGVTGIVVPKNNPAAAAEAIERLVLDPELRVRMGLAGRQHVAENYSWTASIQQMISVYESMTRQK